MTSARDLALAAPAVEARGLSTLRSEYRSRITVLGVPLVHVVRGLDPSTGRVRPAVGVIAVGQVAVGGIAIGQLAVGGVAMGQASFGLVGGVGQLAAGALAVGQMAFGALAAVGQVAVAPLPLGLIPVGTGLAGLALALAGGLWGALALVRLRPLRAILGRRAVTPVASLREGVARIRGRITSDDTLAAPLSGARCAHWQSRRLGPGVQAVERGGTSVLVSDDTGTARVDLEGATVLCEPRVFGEMAAPDWSVQVESFLARGDEVTVAGLVHLDPDPEGDPSLYREAPRRAVFRAGEGDAVIVTTRDPEALRARERFSLGMATALVLGGAAALAPAAPLAAGAVALGGALFAKKTASGG